jgi:hypothetical protein
MDSCRPRSAAALALVLLAAGCSAAGTSPLGSPEGRPLSLPHVVHGRPIPDAQHKYVYVADNYAGTVWIFPAGKANPNPTGSITTGIVGPQGLAVDGSGNLYVANTSGGTVTVYPPGGSSPSLTLSQDLTDPTAVAVDSKGDVWVSNEEGGYQGSLVEFPAGQTTPSTVINNLNPLGIAVDSADNLYAESYNSSTAYVAIYPPGASQPSQTFGQKDLLEPLGVTVGPTGDVYVGDYYYDDVFIFAAKTHKLRHKVFVEAGDLVGLTISRDKRLYVADADMAVVSEISRRGFGKVLADRLHNNLSSAFGVAADPAVAPGP